VRLSVAFLALAVAACAGSSPSPTTPAPATPFASDPTLSEFMGRRDAICQVGSDDIAAINATMDAMSPEDLAVAFRQIAARIRAAQVDLDALVVPSGLSDFVAADNGRRAQRIDLVEQMAAAVVDDPQAMESLDEALYDLNVAAERAEDALRLKHCA